VTEDSVYAVLWWRRGFNCRTVATSNSAVLPSARAIANGWSSSSPRVSQVAIWSPIPSGQFAADSELLVEPEGLARDAFEWQFARVVGDRWGVHMRRLAVG
jgi:hypothetical protein